MDIQIRPIQTLFIWRLLLERDAVAAGGLKPKLSKPDRDRLVEAGLISAEKRKGQGNKIFVQLLDKGWEWASQHLDADLPSGAKASNYILQQFMSRLKATLNRSGSSLADFLTPLPAETASRVSPESRQGSIANDVSRRILLACRQLGNGVHASRIRIADLRSFLPDVSRTAFEESLRALERAHVVNAMPLDNPQERLPEDDSAAVLNGTGEPRHIVYLNS